MGSKFLLVSEKVLFFPIRTMMALPIFLHDLRLGRHYGYPLCCILNFSLGMAVGANKQGLRRGGIHIGDKHYVPCIFHKGKVSAWEPHHNDPRLRGTKTILYRGQKTLNHFYQSVKVDYPGLADVMVENIALVSMHIFDLDDEGRHAAEALLRQTDGLPEIYQRELTSALRDLGYS